MKAIAEISLYPLSGHYHEPIKDFLRRLQPYANLEITVGETSTVVRGAYDDIFDMLNRECRNTLSGPDRSVFVIKLLNTEQ